VDSERCWYKTVFDEHYEDIGDAPSVASSSEDGFSRYEEVHSEFDVEPSEEAEYYYSDSDAYKSANADLSGFGFDALSHTSDSDVFSLMSREHYIDDYTHDLLYDPDYHPEDGAEFEGLAIVPYMLPMPTAWFIFPLSEFDISSPDICHTVRGTTFGLARVVDTIFMLLWLPPTSYREGMLILVVWTLQF